MAFSTTRIETFIKKGVLKDVITMADTAGDSQAMDLADAVHITLEAIGTFGGGTITVQASNDGINYFGMPSGAVSFNANGIKTVQLADLGFSKYRLDLSGGDATTNVTVTIVCRIRSAGTP